MKWFEKNQLYLLAKTIHRNKLEENTQKEIWSFGL
jgi:hypothetical protein